MTEGIHGDKMCAQLTSLLQSHPDAIAYLNMSNGLDGYETALSAGFPNSRIRFSYVQSTQLESRSHDVLLCSLGADMLMELALGRTCVLIDFGSGKDLSRSIYQGVPFIRYCLRLRWFGIADEDATISPRRYDGCPMPVGDDFRKRYHALDRKTKSFLGKFARYAQMPSSMARHHGDPQLLGISARSEFDGHPEHFLETADAIAASRLDSTSLSIAN